MAPLTPEKGERFSFAELKDGKRRLYNSQDKP